MHELCEQSSLLSGSSKRAFRPYKTRNHNYAPQLDLLSHKHKKKMPLVNCVNKNDNCNNELFKH